jgi:hypothetical protein
MSLLEQLVRQLGEVEIDPKGLVLIVDGKPVHVNESISLRVAQPTEKVAQPTEKVVEQPAEVAEEGDEWEWKLALARARARTEREPIAAVRRPLRTARGTAPIVPSDDDVTKKTKAAPPRRHRRPFVSPKIRPARRRARPKTDPIVPPPLPPPPED